MMIKILPFTAEETHSIEISYSIVETRYGEQYIASTAKGICAIGFCTPHRSSEEHIAEYYPNARIIQHQEPIHLIAKDLLTTGICATPLHLHVKATPFQLKVWQELMLIPMGSTETYGSIAAKIGREGASRAVGSAVGANPVALIIPCHRIVRANGSVGHYHWGDKLKASILAQEKTSAPN